MKFNCMIKEIEDDEEVTINIRNVIITGFVNTGICIPLDEEEVVVEILIVKTILVVIKNSILKNKKS